MSKVNDDPRIAATVETSQGNYNIIVARGAVADIGDQMRNIAIGGRAFLIADQAMFPTEVRRTHEALERGGYETHALILELSEAAKSIDTAIQIYQWLAEMRAERIDCIVSMGGGVASDIVGFVAATWLRGVPLVHVPTTLAAMVDAAIGGKTAINLAAGKNLVGAFKQPRLIVQDIDFLDTLPSRELAAGWAEAIKKALILDARLLEIMETNAQELSSLEGKKLEHVIRRAVQIKAQIVSADEFETGDERVLLNYGHTIGHAIEAVTRYGRYLHGEAVSIGMMIAARISVKLGLISQELLDRQLHLLQTYNLPTSLPEDISPDDLLNAAASDKKSRGGKIRWVLLKGPGNATTDSNVPEETVRDAIEETTAK